MRRTRLAALCSTPLAALVMIMPAHAEEVAPEGDIVVTGTRASTKTDTPAIEVPQPVTTITADQYLSQGAINISDTVKYAAGVLANPYGRDTRVDGFGEPFDDRNRNGVRDLASPVTGKFGGPGDVVSYTAEFPAALYFDFFSTIVGANGFTMKATTVLRNEPVKSKS